MIVHAAGARQRCADVPSAGQVRRPYEGNGRSKNATPALRDRQEKNRWMRSLGGASDADRCGLRRQERRYSVPVFGASRLALEGGSLRAHVIGAPRFASPKCTVAVASDSVAYRYRKVGNGESNS